MTANVETCLRCVMDRTANEIYFDVDGNCNYCSSFLQKLEYLKTNAVHSIENREQFIQRIREAGYGKEYDCIVGVSGGVDSSYALYLAVECGLRPLAVHLDNGWNSELAVHNIANLVSTLGVDLYTHVIEWDENRDLQRSFFKANVVDIELLMDNAMLALNYEQASRYGVRYILSGSNTSTEGLAVPSAWNWNKYDARNIRSIQNEFGRLPIRTHPLISTSDYLWYRLAKGVQWIPFLDYFPYQKKEALEVLEREVGYKPYPYKHYESVFTRFYQAYILPRKFGYDKRRVHLSSLIVSGQLSRDEALTLLASEPYPSQVQEALDRAFVLKKLGFSEKEFQAYMLAPAIPHDAYASERWFFDTLLKMNELRRDLSQWRNRRGGSDRSPMHSAR